MAIQRHICKDGATAYYAVYFNPTGRRTTEHARTVKPDASPREHEQAARAARAKADTQRRAVRNDDWKDPREAKPRHISFSKLVELFLAGYRTRSGRPDYYVERFKPWLTAFGERPASSVGVRDVDRVRQEREDLVSDETLRKDLTALSTLYRWAEARGYVRGNPADPRMVKRPPKSRPDPHPLGDSQLVALLDASPAWLARMIDFAAETGADRGEVRALNWNRHVDRERRLLVLPRGKTGVGRTLPYRQNARLRWLLATAGKVRHTSGVVFLDDDGQPIGLQMLRSAMRRAWKRAGLTTPRPWKSLRATFATGKAEAGVDVPTIAALMGLTTAHVLEHYVKPSGVHLGAAMAGSKRRSVQLSASG